MAPIGSDHYPLWATLAIRFRKPKRKTLKHMLDLDATNEQKQIFNEGLLELWGSINEKSHLGWQQMNEALVVSANSSCNIKSPQIKKPWIKEETFTSIKKTLVGTKQ